MRAGHPAARDRLGRRMGAPVREQLRQHMGVRPLRRLAAGRRDRLIDLGAAGARREHAMRAVPEDQPHRGIARLEQRAAGVRRAGPRSARRRRCGCSNRPDARRARDRTARASRSCARSAPRSGPSSVSTARRFIALSASGRQNATRWLQLCVVIVSNATGRRSGRASSRMPPRGVTTDIDCSSRRDLGRLVRIAHEFRDGAERAEAPLRIGSASWPAISSNALAISAFLGALRIAMIVHAR